MKALASAGIFAPITVSVKPTVRAITPLGLTPTRVIGGGGGATVAAHPFSTTETNVGVAEVPDRRVDVLAELSHSKKIVLQHPVRAAPPPSNCTDGARGVNLKTGFRSRVRVGLHCSPSRACSKTAGW